MRRQDDKRPAASPAVQTAGALGGTVLDQRPIFSLEELCRICGVHAELVFEMVEEGVLSTAGSDPTRWRFRGDAVLRVQKAMRLTRDLRVNWPGVALALDLMDEIERLRVEQNAGG